MLERKWNSTASAACSVREGITSAILPPERCRTPAHNRAHPSSWSHASTSVLDAVLIDTLAHERRKLIQMLTVAIAGTTGPCALLFRRLSSREGKRRTIAFARIEFFQA